MRNKLNSGELDMGGEQPDYVSKLSVGLEFIKWAEAHWKLEEKYSTNTDNPNDEKSHYYVTRDCFIRKIDEIIKDRLF